jgi:hypothetical protein
LVKITLHFIFGRVPEAVMAFTIQVPGQPIILLGIF